MSYSDYLYKDSMLGEIEIYFYENEEMVHDVEIYLAGVQIAELPLSNLRKVEAELSALQEENEEIKNSLSLKAIDNSKLELENKKLTEALEFIASCNPVQYKSRTDIIYSIAEKSFEKARKALETK